MVLSDDVHCALERTVHHPEIVTVPLYEDDLVLAASPHHRFAKTGTATIEDVGREPLILFDRGSSYNQLIQGVFRQHGIVPHTLMELDTIEATKKMVEEGLGIALLPKVSTEREFEQKTLVSGPRRRRGDAPAADLAHLPEEPQAHPLSTRLLLAAVGAVRGLDPGGGSHRRGLGNTPPKVLQSRACIIWPLARVRDASGQRMRGNALASHRSAGMPFARPVILFTLAIALIVCSGARPDRSHAAPPPGTVSSITGNGAGDGGPAIDAWLNEPEAVAVNAAGDVYIGNTKSCIVQEFGADGIIHTVAGTGVCGYNGDGMPATSTQLTLPRGIYLDSSGALYIADSGSPVSKDAGNCRVRKVEADRTLHTVAGTGDCDFGGDGGDPTQAKLKNPKSMGVDSQGRLVIADYDNCRIRRVEDNVIKTIAGSDCDVVDPFGITIDDEDRIFIADEGNSRVQVIADGKLQVVAAAPDIDAAQDVALDAAGNLFIADSNDCQIKEVAAPVFVDGHGGAVKTIAGSGTCGYTGEGDAMTTEFNHPGGIAVDHNGNLFVADTMNCRIREIRGSQVATIAGNGGCHTVHPTGLAVDAAGDVFVSDSNVLDCHVLDVTPAGAVTRVAGFATIGPEETQLPCGYSGDGAAAGVKLNAPNALAFDKQGRLYIADTGNCRIRDVDGATIATAVGKGSCRPGADGVAPLDATLTDPEGVAFDASGVMYIADSEHCEVRAVAPGGNITTVAGTGDCGFAGDGGAATAAQVNAPAAVAVDASGNVYIADTGNCRIRRINAAAKTIETVAGNGTCDDGGDGGAPASAALNHPDDVEVAPGGEIYIADTGNCRVRAITRDGARIVTVAGNGTCGYAGDGASAADAEFDHPSRLAFGPGGSLYVADTDNGRVRLIIAPDADAPVANTPPSGDESGAPAAARTDSSGGSSSSTVWLPSQELPRSACSPRLGAAYWLRRRSARAAT